MEILQARILEWVAMSSSRGSSRPRDQTCISYIPSPPRCPPGPSELSILRPEVILPTHALPDACLSWWCLNVPHPMSPKLEEALSLTPDSSISPKVTQAVPYCLLPSTTVQAKIKITIRLSCWASQVGDIKAPPTQTSIWESMCREYDFRPENAEFWGSWGASGRRRSHEPVQQASPAWHVLPWASHFPVQTQSLSIKQLTVKRPSFLK